MGRLIGYTQISHTSCPPPQNFPPRGHSDDDDLNSSETDAIDQPWADEDERYEESNLHDISNGNRRRQNMQVNGNQQTTKEEYKGKIVWFFRNGDIHYKPKRVRELNNVNKVYREYFAHLQIAVNIKRSIYRTFLPIFLHHYLRLVFVLLEDPEEIQIH